MFDNFASQVKKFSDPLEKFNTIMLKNMERVTELQVETIRSLAEMGSAQVKEFTEVKDLEGFKNFSANNMSRLVEFNKKIMEDAKSMGDIGINFKHDVEQLMADFKGAFQAEDNTDEPAEKTAEKTASSAKQTAKAAN
jgi:phasin family protein